MNGFSGFGNSPLKQDDKKKKEIKKIEADLENLQKRKKQFPTTKPRDMPTGGSLVPGAWEETVKEIKKGTD
tara:strand:- start:744 stop:956 length:213 start_codon:yes stop_codon:yes gene_type:complete